MLSPTSRAQLVLGLTAPVAAITAVALPAGATPPGNNGELVFERETPDGADMFTVGADGSGLTRAHPAPRPRGRLELVARRQRHWQPTARLAALDLRYERGAAALPRAAARPHSPAPGLLLGAICGTGGGGTQPGYGEARHWARHSGASNRSAK